MRLATGFCKLVGNYVVYTKIVGVAGALNHTIPFSSGWRKPERNWVKVNVDAHVGENRVIGLGMVIRD